MRTLAVAFPSDAIRSGPYQGSCLARELVGEALVEQVDGRPLVSEAVLDQPGSAGVGSAPPKRCSLFRRLEADRLGERG